VGNTIDLQTRETFKLYILVLPCNPLQINDYDTDYNVGSSHAWFYDTKGNQTISMYAGGNCGFRRPSEQVDSLLIR